MLHMILSVCCYIVPTATEPLSRGIGSVGEEAASNIVGGGSGTGPLGSAATPAATQAASTPVATNSGLSGPHGRHLLKYHSDKIGNASDSNFVYSKEKMRHGLALYVAAAEQPFTFGDDIRFEHFVQNCLNPSFVKVSRNSIRSDTKKAHSEVKKDLISELATVGAIGFTSDMWSGINNRGYICVTAHYIDSSWTLPKKIIAFRLVEFPHDAEQIFESIMSVFRDFEVLDKVYSITFDNHSANTATLPLFIRNLTTPYFGELLHLRCVCHVMNLVVQDGLTYIAPQISKIRNAVLFIATSPSRQQEFDKVCTSLYNLKPKNMNSDVQNRWNSTYLMLKSCRKYSDAISGFVNQRYRPCRGSPLTQADWEIGFEFMKFLKVFYVATVACSSVRYPTSCIVLHHLFNISVTFRRHREHPNFAHACIDMEGKFRKYYEEMPPIFMLAAVMDPRMKLQGVSLLLRTIGTNLEITTLPSSANVYDLLTTMYAKYDSKFRSNATCTSAPLTSSRSTNDEFWDFVSSNLGRSTVTSRIELDKYLNPRILASESAFSAGERVLDERRSRLAPDILDCLICLKDWEDARLGIQKRSAKDEFRGYFTDSDIDISGLKWILWQLMKALNGNMMLPPLQFLAMTAVATYEGLNGYLVRRRGSCRRWELNVAASISVSGYDDKKTLMSEESFGFSGTLRAATSSQAFPQCVFDHWDMMMSDPLESGSQAATLVSEIRKRKGLKEQMTPLSDFEDKL
ncbi:hypothetical protein RHSIM_Rhsim09G0159100 [Rhododendron simsii]|uniref:Transposase n=1 Tax=Rhododendron simsii TaxID=118357 RepID=A0A834GFA6_RHOSS|nr:hypothetical protein RHSIM_Rhsim09G0159100 [Rhododendron simsii]